MAGVRIGLKNIHVALINSEGKYQTPVKIANAISATVTPNVSTNTLYADDKASEIVDNFNDIDVELDVDDLSTEKYALLLGKTVKSDGVIVEKSTDSAPYLALGFESEKSNGETRYVWLFKGRFSIPSDSYSTKGENPEFATQSITGKFVPNDKGEWRAKVDSDDPNVLPIVTGEWFQYVYGHMI